MNKKYTKYCQYIIIICILYKVSSLFSQDLIQYDTDTTFLNQFKGKVFYTYYFNENHVPLRHGKYNFKSDLIKSFENNQFIIKEFNISGEFQDEKKIKQWVFSNNTYTIDIRALSRTGDITLKNQLNGIEKRHFMQYNYGIPEGKWEIKLREVIKGKYAKENTLLVFNFHNGILAGDFLLEDKKSTQGKIEIFGKTNTEGFLDGILSLEYKHKGIKTRELREYQNGFLLDIETYDVNENKLIDKISYDDVIYQLSILNDTLNECNRIVCEQGFGILFDNGYKQSDIKIEIQLPGNDILKKMFESFDRSVLISDSTKNPVYNLTRRFQYIYSNQDDSLVNVLEPRIDSLSKLIRNYTESPRFILRKGASDSMSLAYAFMEHALIKTDICNSVIHKIKNGYFNFYFRSNYYNEGIEGLNIADTIYYQYNNKNLSSIFNTGILINSPDKLLENMVQYIHALEKMYRKWIEFSEAKILYYKEQDNIDSLDAKIVSLRNTIDSLYRKEEFISKEMKDNPFHYKVYLSTNERLIKPNEKIYLESNEFNKKETSGTEIICLLEVLKRHYEDFLRIEKLPRYWNDSLFTVYQVNPFDNRALESKILGNIHRAGMHLLRHYAEEILRTPNCERIIIKYNKIKAIENKIKDLAQNHEEEEVKYLNSALRRENIPSRIERVLDL